MKPHLDALALSARFEGGRACLHLYTVTHGTAVVRLQKAEMEGFLVFSECTALRLPTSGRYVLPRIAQVPDEADLFAVSCEETGVSIECGSVDMRDDYPAYGELGQS